MKNVLLLQLQCFKETFLHPWIKNDVIHLFLPKMKTDFGFGFLTIFVAVGLSDVDLLFFFFFNGL